MEFEISMDYTPEDFEAFWRTFGRKKPDTPERKQASPGMHRNVGLLFLAGGLLSWVWVSPLLGIPELILGGLLVYSGWYLGRPGAASRWAEKAWKKYREGERLKACRFTEEGVWILGGESCRYDYETLEALWEDGERFYLALPGRRPAYYILNKRRFTAGAPEDLPTLWQERSGKPVKRVL